MDVLESLKIQLLVPGGDLEAASDDVWNILQTVDRDFVPRLSSRTENQLDLTTKEMWDGPISFFEIVMRQHVLMAYLDDQAAGMLSFIPRFDEPPMEQWSPSTYATCIAVYPKFRRKRIAAALNNALEQLPAELASPFIARRTWSTNVANLTLLKGRGFEEVVRMVDHRGPGIDTIYLARRTNPDEAL